MSSSTFGRRTAISGTAALAAGAALAGCSGGSGTAAPAGGSTTTASGGGTTSGSGPTTAASSAAASSASQTSAPASSAASGSADALTTTADVAVGGGVILQDAKVVVTQPTAGQYKAFSAVCTHQGCLVGSISDGDIVCPCHGSKFSITDGSVKAGPATAPLESKSITVSGQDITLAG